MRVGVLGGTGNLGKGLALRLAKAGYDVMIGSRDRKKAEERAEEYSGIVGVRIRGDSNRRVSEVCDVVIIAIPWKNAFEVVEELRESLKGKIVVSPIVPMEKTENGFVYVNLPEGSAAEKVASILGSRSVVSAYHNIPARRFSDLNERVEWDVAVCGDDDESKRVVMEITNSMDGLRALDAGPLSNSRIVESLTPLLINIALRNRMKELSIKFV